MNTTDFIAIVEQDLEEITPGSLNKNSVLREIPGWSSMMALILIAKIDSEYDVTITADDLTKCITIDDLFQVVFKKQGH